MKLYQQDKGSTGVNDEVDSTGSSSTSGSNEKAAPLVLLQEFALNTLLVSSVYLFFVSPSTIWHVRMVYGG